MKILIVKLHAIGDLVITTPALRRIREGLPEAELHLLTCEWSAPALENHPAIQQFHVVNDALFFKPGIGTLPDTISLIRKMRNNPFYHIN